MAIRKKKATPVEELPRLDSSEEWRVARSERDAAQKAYERARKCLQEAEARLDRLADAERGAPVAISARRAYVLKEDELVEAERRLRCAQWRVREIEAGLLPEIHAAHKGAAVPLVDEALALAERLREIHAEYEVRRRAAAAAVGNGDPTKSPLPGAAVPLVATDPRRLRASLVRSFPQLDTPQLRAERERAAEIRRREREEINRLTRARVAASNARGREGNRITIPRGH